MNYKTAGESHGHGLLAFIEGFPSDFPVDTEKINAQLRRRQGGYGRGGRQKIESDSVEILTGLWQGRTTGAPITLWVKNKDSRIDSAPEISSPRPGHVDLAGSVKYGLPIRPIMERASARETAARVAAGALAQQFLESKGIRIIAFVRSIGRSTMIDTEIKKMTPDELLNRRELSDMYTVFPEHDTKLKSIIDDAQKDGDTLGGVIECHVFGVPIGLGSHVQCDEKLDGLLAQAVMSIQGIKGVEIGMGFEVASHPGSQVHDPIGYDESLAGTPCGGFVRDSNNAGGIEGGISNGQPIIIRAAMKPIPTLKKPLQSIDLKTKQALPAIYERSDVCAVPAASVVLECVVAATLLMVND